MSQRKRQRWIVVENWDRFQHYRDRRPNWIKSYTDLLGRPEYAQLTFPQRGILHGLWLLYAESSRNIPVNTSYLSRQLGGKVQMRSLEALRRAGFIRFSASKPLAPGYQDAMPEKEKEKDTRAVRSTGDAQPSNIAQVIDISLRGSQRE